MNTTNIISKKQISHEYHRKFFEEIVEERKLKCQAVARKLYLKSKRKYDIFRSKQNAAFKVNEKDVNEPPWYHELSNYQMNILHELRYLIERDYKESSVKRTKIALLKLGVKTKIPKKVINDAIEFSKLYPIDFLLRIKEYVMEKNIKTTNNNPVMYSFYEKLIITGIVYLGMPSLLAKLDYCLSNPTPDPKFEYIEKKSTLHSNYISPFVEPPKILQKIWNRNEKIKAHNLTIKHQKQKERMRNEMKNIERNSEESKIKRMELEKICGHSLHPLDVLFYKPVLNSAFRSAVDCEEKEDKLHEGIRNGLDKSVNIDDNILVKNNNVIKFSAASDTPNLTNTDDSQTLNESLSFLASSSSCILKEICPEGVKFGTLTKYGSENFEFDVIEESEIEEEIEDEDFSFLNDEVINEKGYEFFCEQHNLDNENQLDSDKVDTYLTPKLVMMGIMKSQAKSEASMIRMFNCRVNAFPGFKLPTLGGTEDNKTKQNYCTEIAERRKVRYLLHDETKLDKTDDKIAAFNQTLAEATPNQFINETTSLNEAKNDTVHIYDEVLTDLRNFPPCLQFKAILEFLAILGDPIAGLPKLTHLEVLKKWYESRLNQHKPLTKKRKAELLESSVRLWDIPKSKKQAVSISLNPIDKYGKRGKKLTWNNEKMTSKIINAEKEDFLQKMKALRLEKAKYLYTTFKTVHYKNKLNAEFKKTFYCYFPAKEDDCIFVNLPNYLKSPHSRTNNTKPRK